MEDNQSEILTEIVQKLATVKRRTLLPWWIKFFIWVFIIFGSFVPIGIVSGLLGINFHLSLYGLETNEPLSAIGIIISLLFLFKGITAYVLWTEKDWAILFGGI
jgi:hypothetical protein